MSRATVSARWSGGAISRFDRPPPVRTEAPLDAPQRPLALSAMADQRARPEGIPGSPHAGPFPVGAYAAELRDELRELRARAAVRRGLRPASAGAREGLLRAARRARARVPCSMWRDDFDALGLPRRARRRRAGRRRRRLRLLPGLAHRPRRRSRSRSPACASPARATCSPSSSALRRALAAEGLFEPQKRAAAPGAAAHDRRRHRRGRQGARRRARRPAPPRLGRAARVGLRAGAGPPRRAGDHARAAGPRGAARRSR